MTKSTLFVSILLLAGCAPQQPPLSTSHASEYNTVIHELKDAKVPDSQKARGIAMQAMQDRTKRCGMRDARASLRCEPAFTIDFNIPDFAAKGDRIWPVNEIWLMNTVCTAWVNAENGKARIISSRKTACSRAVKYRITYDNSGREKTRVRYEPLRSNLSAAEFRKALVGQWKSAFTYKNRRNVRSINFSPDGRANVIVDEGDSSRTQYAGPYTVTFEREPNKDAVTIATITVQPKGKPKFVLSRVNFGLHNGLNVDAGVVLRIDSPPHGALKKEY